MAKYIDIFTEKSSGAPGVTEIVNFQRILPKNREIGFYSLGFPPEQQPPKFEADLLQSVFDAAEDRYFAAVAGCGLDRQRGPNMDVQREYFVKLAAFADEHRKPLVANCGKSFADLQEVHTDLNPGNPWVIQGFNKNKSLAKKLLTKGMYLSFGSEMFYDRNTAEAVGITPFNRLFLESGINDDESIEDVYLKTAQIKGVSTERLKEIIARNFEVVFGINEKAS